MGRRILCTLALGAGLAGVARADVEVQGVWQFEDKAFGYSGWSNNDPIRNIRKADVLILDDTGAVIASGSTDGLGAFSISTPAPAVGQEEIFIRVVADTLRQTGFQRIRVLDDTSTVYGSTAPTSFFIDDSMTTLDVGTFLVPKVVLSGGEEGNPFNLLDMAVRSFDYLTGQCGRSPSGFQVRVHWPANGSFASFQDANLDFDDGYDDSVILHEVGHVVHNLYSDSDSPGGTHFFGDSNQDPRLSLGEGFATFWAGAVFDSRTGRDALYMDCNSTSQVGGVQLRLRLEETEPYTNDAFGAADEVSVACTLYDIVDTENSVDQGPGVDDDPFVAGTLIDGKTPHEAWFEMFEGPAATASNVTLNDFWDGWFAVHGASGLHTEMAALFALHRVPFAADDAEPNDTRLTATPLQPSNAWVTDRTLYDGAGAVPVPGLGDLDWYASDLVVGSRITVETRYPNNASDADTQCDTQLSIWDPAGQQVSFTNSGGTGRNAAIADFPIDASGTWSYRVRTTHSYRQYGAYDVRVRYTFENLVPAVSAGPSADPPVVNERRNATLLSVTATDAQALSYAWTPLDGGTIVGSGPSVTFLAPAGSAPAAFRVRLVVTDSLGAATPPLEVVVPRIAKEVQGQP